MPPFYLRIGAGIIGDIVLSSYSGNSAGNMRTYHRRERVRRALYPTYQSSTADQATAYVDYRNLVVDTLVSRRRLMNDALQQLASSANVLTEVAMTLVEILRSGHKVLALGNGGSAAEAQHFVAELVGRFKRERSAYAALALTTDTAVLTAVANDYGYQDIFARQVAALGQPGDLLLAFSTSGESENVVQAATIAHQRQMCVVAITGKKPSRLEALADLAVRVPGIDTAMAQELHMIVTHLLCDITEQQLSLHERFEGEDVSEPESISIVMENETWQQ
jgi:D-sedoheptulose 7-phosphate isomerase